MILHSLLFSILTDIKKRLPHRFPFLLVDKIIALDESSIVGIKNVTFNESFFQGHFPDEPVMPGVLLVEALAQTGGLLVLSSVEEPEKYSTYFLKIDKLKFKQKVVPGDTVILKNGVCRCYEERNCYNVWTGVRRRKTGTRG